VKFSALNVDFSSASPDPLGSRKPAHAGVKEGYFSKKWLFSDIGSFSVETGTDMLLIITSTGDELFSGINIDDLELP